MKKIFIFCLASFLSLTGIMAQFSSVEELEKAMKANPKLIVVDARAAADYVKTHINGAINIDVSTLSNASPVEGTLKPVSELASILGKAGIAKNSKVVIYCKTGVNASRLKWILNYLGNNDVTLLDGNLEGWFTKRKPITKTAKTLAATNFTPVLNNAMIVDKAYVKSKLGNASTIIIDNRKKADFDAGHIGNAINIDYENMLTGTKLKPADQIATLYSKIDKNKEIIVYCKTGVSACLTYFALKDILKYPNVKLYEGAYLDWSK